MLVARDSHVRLRKRRSLLKADRFIAPSYKLRRKFLAQPHGEWVEESVLLSFQQYQTMQKLFDPEIEVTRKVGVRAHPSCSRCCL